MKEEQDIIKRCGKENPFKVPENYFEDFTCNLMNELSGKEGMTALDTLPDEPTITLWQRVKPLLYMAAMFIGMIVCVRTVLDKPTTSSTDNFAEYEIVDIEQMSDEELATMVEYTMMDNYTLYQYLSEAE